MGTYSIGGATGNVGGALVGELLEAGHQVRAIVRGENSAAALPEGAEPFMGDLSDGATLHAAFHGAEGVYLLSGYDDEGIVAELERAGVPRAVLLSSSSAPTGKLDNAVAAYHLASERALSASSVATTYLRPNSFMSNALRWKPQLDVGDVVRDAFPDVAVATNDPADVAAVAAIALTTPEYEGEALRLTGPEALTPGERLAILAEALGRELRFEGQTDAEARAEMESQMPKEYVDAFFEFFADGIVDETTILPTIENVTGRAPVSFRAWCEAHAGDFA